MEGRQKVGKTAAQRLSATYNCAATSRLTPSCGGILRLAAAFVTFCRSHPPNPSKDRLTPSNVSTRCLFLASGRLCQAMSALYRYEQHNLPMRGLMQILIVGNLRKCTLLFHD